MGARARARAVAKFSLTRSAEAIGRLLGQLARRDVVGGVLPIEVGAPAEASAKAPGSRRRTNGVAHDPGTGDDTRRAQPS